MPVHGFGPAPARLMFVGEAPGGDEMIEGRPFVGYSGQLLNELLRSMGIDRSEVFVTNVARERAPMSKIGYLFLNHNPRTGELPKPVKGRKPPTWLPGPVIEAGLKALREEVERVNPAVIIPMGNTALWAIQGEQSITKWRGSILTSKPEFGSRKTIPTFHPAYILRAFGDYPCLQADLHRVRDQSSTREVVPPKRNYVIRPTLAQVQEAAAAIKAAGLAAVDIETRNGQISCISFAHSLQCAICIPLMDSKTADGAYWSAGEEWLVWQCIRDIFSSIEVVGQNWSYDATYLLWRHGVYVPAKWDTMLMHHVAYAGMEKSLDFMASLYCKWYRYWKDDGKEWDTTLPEEQHWQYNCDDGVYTLELKAILEQKLHNAGLLDLYHYRMKHYWPPLFKAMQRGIKANKQERDRLATELSEYLINMADKIQFVLAHPFNPGSSQQVATLMYEDFGAAVILDHKTKAPTTKDDALELIGRRMPWLRQLCEYIADYRSAQALQRSVGIIDEDGRLRTNLNLGGAATFRLSSTKNNFGTGMNFQNLAKGEDDEKWHPGRLEQPNLRLMFEPDHGHTLADIDLQRADLVVVAEEAGDAVLKQQLAEGYNPYKIAACQYIGCTERELEEKYAARYTMLKSFYHGTNYTGSARTMARNCGLTVAESEHLQRVWFGEHPGIKRWHERTLAQLRATKQVTNRFGYRRWFADRPESVLSEAVAWIPQSTVAIVTLEMIKNLQHVPEVEFLLQVHDSILVQYATWNEPYVLRKLRPWLDIPVPYPEPLLLKPGLATSTKSWGLVQKRPWPQPWRPPLVPSDPWRDLVVGTGSKPGTGRSGYLAGSTVAAGSTGALAG